MLKLKICSELDLEMMLLTNLELIWRLRLLKFTEKIIGVVKEREEKEKIDLKELQRKELKANKEVNKPEKEDNKESQDSPNNPDSPKNQDRAENQDREENKKMELKEPKEREVTEKANSDQLFIISFNQ